MKIRLTAAVAALALLCTGCTDGGWLDRTRLSFHTDGIGTALASEDRTRNSLTAMTSRRQEVLAVLDITTSTHSGHRAAYSPDNGASWLPVLFDGNEDPGMALAGMPTSREGQWLLLGLRHGEVFAFTSINGRDFRLQPEPILETTATSLNAVVGTAQGWLLATTPHSGSASTAMTLYQSTDGSAWTGRDGTAAGLPAADSTFHPLSMAAGPDAVLLVGQEVPPSRPPYARAFSSTDGGNSWVDTSPDSSGVGPLGNGLWTAAWSGTEFRVTGHAWPADRVRKDFPVGMAGSWTPGGAWQLGADPSWSSQTQGFPRQSDVAYGSAGAVARQTAGGVSVDLPKVLLQRPGQPWSELLLPAPAAGGLRLYSEVTAVADGFLVAGTDSQHGNEQILLWHVDAGGVITGRHAALEAAAPLLPAGDGPHITGFSSSGGKSLAFGSVRSQPTIWELEGEREFSNYTALVSDDDQTLDTLTAGPRGLMLLGSRRTVNSHLPAIWSRPEGGAWSEYTGNIFGAGTENGESPVKAVLPSSHGFLAAGWFHADGADHAGIAVSEDGTTWSHVQAGALRGKPSMGRYIGSLAETTGGTVVAGGSIDEGTLRRASVWASPDARTWTPVLLPRAEGYPDARVMSLTAGPLRTVAVVQHSSTGKPDRYSTYSSADDGLTWEHGTDLDAPSPDQDVTAPRIAVKGDGFVLVATQGVPRRHTPVLMVSGDGRQFAGVPVDHEALEQENLSVSAIGIAGKRLMIAGITGPADKRESFGISIEVTEH
ncbi:sialidase family protein [Arthrobacter sp. HMWF013]|uniref:sialidase family protein n=1 Tax=Arthrobacter sp. HMWF013 TaxID=2056849 RepID=UPI0011B28580|nr:sialidase family protein [Arthrobacter sp. HMWF013]